MISRVEEQPCVSWSNGRGCSVQLLLGHVKVTLKIISIAQGVTWHDRCCFFQLFAMFLPEILWPAAGCLWLVYFKRPQHLKATKVIPNHKHRAQLHAPRCGCQLWSSQEEANSADSWTGWIHGKKPSKAVVKTGLNIFLETFNTSSA